MTQMKSLPLAIALALGCSTAFADERQSLEALQHTTMSLIEVLVENGVLKREQADAMVQEAERRAAQAVAQKAAEAPAAGAVRIPYVPQIVRDQIRDEIKQEVLAEAKEDRWAAPNAIPEWVSRIQWEGDVRLRFQSDRYADDNTPAANYANALGVTPGTGVPAVSGSGAPYVTRNAGAAEVSDNGTAIGNVTDDVNRWRVRARLGVLARLSNSVSAGVRMATGNTGDRVSTNQTLGQNLNKYTFVLDRAYINYAPFEWLKLSGGRIPNPWFATDLVWDDDLNFEGVAATASYPFKGGCISPFVTAGWFPLRPETPGQREDRSLQGVQLGLNLRAAEDVRFRFGVAQYDYKNIEGRVDNAYTLGVGAGASYGQYGYETGLRAKGNTLFTTNSSLDGTAFPAQSGSNPIWGLAAKFKPLVLTATADLASFDPVHVMVSAEYVKNLAFDRDEIFRRTGLRMSDGSDRAYLLRLAVGMPSIKEVGDWNASITYRNVGSDSVLDAFTDSDFGLGGTNMKGYTLSFAYGLDNRTSLGLKYSSAKTVDSPTLLRGEQFGVDTLQLDLAVKF
ncbi:putative porin [Denitromonas iodatirespirans]|uniref:Porin n=1 Tax=Denitromonas iodatirespirans TaxID=2795389 RepID=A0A944HCH0_DENI1|nr:putative porin [Denitromonas iodatirespirans]MBT0962707.1 putative porin [Denitromonas iodatirespirans]